jgi:uncharacterized membrane protein YhaH (DUF805 family)
MSGDIGATGLMSIFVWMFLTFALAFVFLLVFSYVFKAFAYMSIAKKTKQHNPGISFIPFVGPRIVAYKSSKMHWWPGFLLIGLVIPFLGQLMILVFCVITVYWHWKMFENLNRPGWWSILALIPIVNYFLLGFAAWENSKPVKKSSKKRK